MAEDYANVREILGSVVGKRVIDVTQHDREDFDRESGKGAFVMLMFEDGSSLKFPIGDDAFEYGCDEHEIA